MNSLTARTLLKRSISLAPSPFFARESAFVGLPRHSGVPFRSSSSASASAVCPAATTPALTVLVQGRSQGRDQRRQTHSMATNGATNGAANGFHELRFKHPAILVCDIQQKFQTAIHEFDKIVLTSQKLIKFANSFSIPVHATTQTVAKLGPTVPSIADLLPSTPFDKTKFSMYTADLAPVLPPGSSIALVGIETHICITQTALDLRDAGHKVYIIADGVSSCNPGEVVVALDRLRAEQGITVTSSESWMYECVGDASHPGFRGLIGIVKNSMGDTRNVLRSLPPKI